MSNPFTLVFGKKPVQYVSRIVQTNRIIEDYEAVPAVNQICMVTGVRGSGKTVMMTNIADMLSKRDDWIVVELNATRDLLQSLASRLYAVPRLHDCFLKAKLDFSAFGLGVSIENAAPVTDVEDMVAKMLDQLQKLGKRLLITIDEVVYSEQFSVYRERLKRKGVIDTRQYGMVSMALPRFEEFIKMRML